MAQSEIPARKKSCRMYKTRPWMCKLKTSWVKDTYLFKYLQIWLPKAPSKEIPTWNPGCLWSCFWEQTTKSAKYPFIQYLLANPLLYFGVRVGGLQTQEALIGPFYIEQDNPNVSKGYPDREHLKNKQIQGRVLWTVGRHCSLLQIQLGWDSYLSLNLGEWTDSGCRKTTAGMGGLGAETTTGTLTKLPAERNG